MDKALARGMKFSVEAGIMPITNAKQLGRSVNLSGATLPKAFMDIVTDDADAMFEAGLLEEARRVFERFDAGRISAIGYPELFAYFRGECGLDEATARIKQYSRNYAKRQLTWFRRGVYDLSFCSDECSAEEAALEIAAAFNAAGR